MKKRLLNDRNDYDSATRSRKRRCGNISNEEHRHQTDPKNLLYVSNLDAVDWDLFTSFLYHMMKDLCLLYKENDTFSIKDFISGKKIGKRGTGLIFFVEFRDATAALQLNNIPFMGKKVGLERPKTWSGPKWLREAHCSWDDRLEKAYSEGRNTRGNEDSNSRESLLTRELVIKNIPSGWADAVHKYIASSMEQIGLVKGFEDPVEDFRLDHKNVNTGLLTFRTEECARNAFRLQNLPFLNHFICFERCKNDPSRSKNQDSEQNWSKSMNDFFSNTCTEKCEEKVNESSPVGKQEHDIDRIKMRLEVAERKVEESLLQNRTLSAALSNKSRLLETCEDTVRSKDLEISRLKEEQENLKVAVKDAGRKFEESLLENKALSETLNNKSRLLEKCEDTERGKVSEISRLQEEQTSLMATVKQVGIERDSIKRELEGSKLSLTKTLSSLTEAQSTKTVQDSGEADFLRKELEIKRAESHEKTNRIKELEVASERHMERIMNLTDGLLSGGTKQRKLEEKLQKERVRRISLETDLARKEENNENGIVDSGVCAILVKEEHNFYDR